MNSQKIVQIFFLDLPPKRTKEFLRHWDIVAEHLKQNPGLMYINLHKEIGKSPQWLIYTLWESDKDCRQTTSTEEFKSLIAWGLRSSQSYQLIRQTEHTKKRLPIIPTNVLLVIIWLAGIIFAGIILFIR